MAAAVSELCVWQGSTLLDCFIQCRGCKVEQSSPLFHLYLYLFFKFRRASVLFYANLVYDQNFFWGGRGGGWGGGVAVKDA